MTKKIALLALVALMTFSSALFAQFGIPGVPQIVIDPTAIGRIGEELVQLYKQYAVLEQSYATAMNTYKRVEANAQQITNKDEWRYMATPLMYPSTADAYGTSGGWITAVNRGVNTVGAYESATVRMSAPATWSNQLSNAMRNEYGKQAATVELNDAMAMHTMAVTGAARSQAAAQLAALNALQRDSLSNDPLMNSEVGILNKVNAASVTNAMASQQQLQLLAAMADAQTVEMKQRHDALVREMNYSVAAGEAKQANTDAIWGGQAKARSTRLP